MQAEPKTRVNCKTAKWLAMEEHIDQNLEGSRAGGPRQVNTSVHQQSSDAAMAAEAQSVDDIFVHNIAKVLSNWSVF